MNKIAIVLTLFLATTANAKTLTIAVIDTGIDRALPNLCRQGHKSFVATPHGGGSALVDEHGHGSHIAGLISQYAGAGDYCLVAIKYYSEHHSGRENLMAMIDAINYAINIKVDFINISGGGPEPQSLEREAINKALKNGIKVVVAAGNEHESLDRECNYFPACYDPRIVMVGNLQRLPGPEFGTERSPSSNYGNRVTRWEIGTDVESTLPGGRVGTMSGTSQATAIATGKMVKEALQRR